MLKVILYILCIFFIYRTLSRLLFGTGAIDTKKKTTKGGKSITYQDAEYEEID